MSIVDEVRLVKFRTPVRDACPQATFIRTPLDGVSRDWSPMCSYGLMCIPIEDWNPFWIWSRWIHQSQRIVVSLVQPVWVDQWSISLHNPLTQSPYGGMVTYQPLCNDLWIESLVQKTSGKYSLKCWSVRWGMTGRSSHVFLLFDLPFIEQPFKWISPAII